MTRRRGISVLVGLPTGEFPLPVFDIVPKRITVRGSAGGTRADMQEALAIAAAHGIAALVTTEPLAEINNVFDRLRGGRIQGRVVIDFNKKEAELTGSRAPSLLANLR